MPKQGRRLKVTFINLVGPVLIGDAALFALQYGQDFLATVAGLLFVVTFIIGACSAKLIR